MKLYKIMALIYADFMLMRNSKWRLVEYFYFPITTIIIWGLFSVFVRSYAAEAGIVVLAVNILWNFAYLAQSHVNMQINEDSWSGSIKQIFVSGISDMEYIAARVISATMMSVLLAVVLVALSIMAFDLAIFLTQWEIFSILMLATLTASIGLSIVVAALMIALGREYGFLAWTIMQLFIMLSAPFYPITTYPEIMRPIVSVMPFTAIFEAARAAIAGTVAGESLISTIYIALAYLSISVPIYKYTMRKAVERGWLTRMG